MFAFERYITIPKIAFVGGILLAIMFFALQQEWFIWRGPLGTITGHKAQHTCKEIKLYYWQHEQLKDETIQQIWVENEQQNLHYLINRWLTFLYDEECITQKIRADTTMLNPSGTELFISFDRKPFSKEISIWQKIQFIKALFTTISPVSSINQVRFLVMHKPLCDPHLDFDVSWSMSNLQDCKLT